MPVGPAAAQRVAVATAAAVHRWQAAARRAAGEQQDMTVADAAMAEPSEDLATVVQAHVHAVRMAPAAVVVAAIGVVAVAQPAAAAAVAAVDHLISDR